MLWIAEFFPASRQSPVFRYGSEKAIALARSGVAVMDEMIKSILRVCNDGIKPSKGMF